MRYYYDFIENCVLDINQLVDLHFGISGINRNRFINIGNFDSEKSKPFVHGHFILHPFEEGYKSLFYINGNKKLMETTGFVKQLEK